MSRAAQLACLLVVLLGSFNGARSDPDSPVMRIVGIIRDIHWSPLQNCWAQVANEVKENCPDIRNMVSSPQDLMSCFRDEAGRDFAQCFQIELGSNGPNLFKLASEIVANIRQRNPDNVDVDAQDQVDGLSS